MCILLSIACACASAQDHSSDYTEPYQKKALEHWYVILHELAGS